MPNCTPTPVPARCLGVHRAHGVEKESDQRDEENEEHAVPGERHAGDHDAGQQHARHHDPLAAHTVREMTGERPGDEAGDLEQRHADADDERRIVEFVREVDRQEREQPRLRHAAERRAARNQHQSPVPEQTREVAEVAP